MYSTEITAKIYKLKELILNCQEYKEVKEKEKLMEDKCGNLLIKYNYLFNEYNEALRFKDYGSDVESKQKSLYECKKELDDNIYVKEYRKAYKKMNVILKNIENILFEGIIINNSIVVE